jgi:hypothetical protein
MQNENVVTKLDQLLKEIDKIEKAHPYGLTEEADRRIDKLMCECIETTKELNTIYRTMLRTSPEKMAEWKNVTGGFDQRCKDYLKFLDDPESSGKNIP